MLRLLIILSVVLVGLHSCVESSTPHRVEIDPNELNNDSDDYQQHYSIYTHNGCEYIVSGMGNTRWGSHKGDCKNPIHKCNCK